MKNRFEIKTILTNTNIKDIILNLPYSETDRSKLSKLNDLEIGKIQKYIDDRFFKTCNRTMW